LIFNQIYINNLAIKPSWNQKTGWYNRTMILTGRDMQIREIQKLHNDFKHVALQYRKAQAKLIEHTQLAEKHKLYLKMGFSHMYNYVTDGLGLSDATACNVINVSRVAVSVPELKDEIENGNIGLTKARKLCPVLKESAEKNDKEAINGWIKLAKTVNTRTLERKVSEVSPAPKRRDDLRQIGKDTSRLTIDISDEDRETLERLVDIISNNKANKGFADSVMIAVKDYVQRNDPMERALRSKAKDENKSEILSVTENLTPSVTGKRKPLSQKLKHEVILKYNGQCASKCGGKRCNATRDLHIHHIEPVSEGGKDELDNLILLCGNHHRLIHE
jgi:hypothetical protein